MNFLFKWRQILSSLGADQGCKMPEAGLLGQQFFQRTFKVADKDSHSTDSSVSGEEILQD